MPVLGRIGATSPLAMPPMQRRERLFAPVNTSLPPTAVLQAHASCCNYVESRRRVCRATVRDKRMREGGMPVTASALPLLAWVSADSPPPALLASGHLSYRRERAHD